MLRTEIEDFDHIVEVLKYDYLGRTNDTVIPVPRDIVEYLVRVVGPDHDKEIAGCYDNIRHLEDRVGEAEYNFEAVQGFVNEIYHILKCSDYTYLEKRKKITECVINAMKVGGR